MAAILSSPSKQGQFEATSPSSPHSKAPLSLPLERIFESNSPVASPCVVDEADQKRRRTGQGVQTAGFLLPPMSPVWSTRAELDAKDWWAPEILEDESYAETYAPVRVAFEELKRYFEEYSRAAKDPWWCRKSGKVVLSVVVCRRGANKSDLVAFRGMNTEVCLPAGSLCAEIAAISRAAADFYSSSSIVAVATLDPYDKANPLWPCSCCESWFIKLKRQSSEIIVLAVSSSSFEKFAVRVNGEYQQMPRSALHVTDKSHNAEVESWPDHVILCDGTSEMPWEAAELVYVDGAWTFMNSAHLGILKEAKSRGSHLLVGVHSDEVLKEQLNLPVLEPFETRFDRILQDRYVSSVLKNAPWTLTADMLESLGVKKVICAFDEKSRCNGNSGTDPDPYKVARELGILEEVPLAGETSAPSIARKLT